MGIECVGLSMQLEKKLTEPLVELPLYVGVNFPPLDDAEIT